jgi:ABC-type dipeptide/oligopeptide/nickel transport system permease component
MVMKLSILNKSERGAVLKYFIKRLVALVLIIVAISIGSFYMIHLLPGDLATMILGAGNTPENKKRLFAQLGLDKGAFFCGRKTKQNFYTTPTKTII